MPSQADDKYFGRKEGSSQKAFEAMVAHYGFGKAMQVWHAMRNDRMKAKKTYGSHKARRRG